MKNCKNCYQFICPNARKQYVPDINCSDWLPEPKPKSKAIDIITTGSLICSKCGRGADLVVNTLCVKCGEELAK